MYKPKLEDIEVSDWSTPIAEDPTKQFCQLVIFLNGGKSDAKIDDGLNYSFGYYIPVKVSVQATDAMKQKILRKAANQLIKEFDVKKIAKENNYAGDLDYLRPLSLVGLHKITDELHP